MKKTKKLVNLLLVTLLAVGAVVVVVWLASREGGYGEPAGTYHSPTVFAMDTTLDFTIQGRSTAQAKADVAACVERAKQIEAETSQFKTGSDVFKINAQAGVAPVKVSDDTFRVVKTALEYSKLMNGSFDVTIAPVVRLWGFYDQKYRIPSPQEVAAAQSLVGYQKVALDEQNKTVMLTQKGMAMDLGGIAKGYAVGEVHRMLKERGVTSALVNFGGAIGAIGKRVDGKDWVIGIKDPRGESGALVGELKVNDAFVSSSGDYERFFIKDGKRYFHIFDPATGYNPKDVISTTVVGPTAMLTDTLSKILVMGPNAGMAFMKTQPEFEALMIDSNGKFQFTPNFKTKYALQVKDQL